MNEPLSNPARAFRRYLCFLFATAAVVYLGLISINAAGDPFADFYFLTGLRQPSVRTLDNSTDVKFKSRLVRAAGRDGLDAAVFGSSRVMRINPGDPAFTSLGPRVMNLGVQGARLGQMVEFVEFATLRSPRCIPIVGLDFFAFNDGPLGRSIFLDEAHPLPAWGDALAWLATDRTLSPAWSALRGEPPSNTLLANGLAVRQRPAAATVQAQVERFASLDWQTWQHFRGFHYDPVKIEVLRALLARHPRTVFFVNPVSRWYREGQTKAGLEPAHAQWLADLGTVGRVLDFSSAESIVSNVSRYYDMHHFDGEAGALIMADVAAFLHGEPLRTGRLLAAPGLN